MKLAIYIAPLKALCNEKFQNWKKMFEKNKLQIPIQELTGDTDFKFTKDYYREEEET